MSSAEIEAAAKLLGVIPPILWTGFAILLGWALRPQLAASVQRLTNFEAYGVRMTLAARAVDQAVELAQKSDHWFVAVPVEAREAALARARRERELLRDAEILWVDDQPVNNRNEWRMFVALGAFVTAAADTRQALAALAAARTEKQQPFHVIISDMSRGGDAEAGLTMLSELRREGVDLPVIFYVGIVREADGPPAGAFALTNRPDRLLQSALDALARTRPFASR